MAQWDVVSQTPDADSKWAVTSVVREPQEGDLHMGGDPPEGFHAVTGDNGQATLRKNLGVGDISQMLGDLPGVGMAQHMGAGAVDLARKAASGVAGLFGASPETMQSVRGDPVELPPSNDPVLHALGAVNEGAQAISAPVDEAVNQLPDAASTTVHALEEAIPDVAAVAGARAPLKGVGPTAGDVVQGVKKAIAAPGNATRAAAGEGEQWFKAGLRTGGGHPIARQVADSSGKDALVHHNSQVSNVIAASEAGHAPDAPLSYESLAQAREAPSSVYNRIAHGLPEGQLDDATKTAITDAGSPAGGRMTKGSPQAQQAITDLKSQLLDPNRSFTGQQMVNELRGLRQEGFTNSASDDVSNQQLGKAQLDIARALEGHIGRNIPKGGDVSLEQFQEARKALAKNWSVQSALRGNDVDPKAIGRVYRADPELLDGGLKMLGEFAEGPGKDVVGIPDRYNPPGTLKDVAGIANIHRPVQSTLEGIPGVGASARRILTGNTAKAIDQATAMFPGRSPNAFAPRPGLTPPPGRVGRPGLQPPEQIALGDFAQGAGVKPWMSTDIGANPDAAAQGPMGDFAAVLSQGLEQPGAPGLSLGPMGLPQGEGLPFSASPDMVGAKPRQGGAPKNEPAKQAVKLGDRFAASGMPEKLGDMAGVSMQGVPEDIMARAQSGKKTAPPQVLPDTGGRGLMFKSENGQLRARVRGDVLQVTATLTKKGAQGAGEGTQRMLDAIEYAQEKGLRVASDTKVSTAASKVYDRLEKMGYRVTRNAAELDDEGNYVSTDNRPVFEVEAPLGLAFK